MSRRSGLGRGLAALIPPASRAPEAEPATDEETSGSAASASDATADAAAARAGQADDHRDEGSSGVSGPDVAAPVRSEEDREDVEGTVDGSGTLDGSATGDGRGTADGPRTLDGRPTFDDPGTFDRPATFDGSGTIHRPATPDEPAHAADPSAAVPAVIDAGTATYAEVDPSSIVPNPRQPREVFDPEEIEGLAASLADLGMLQPLIVRSRGEGYELIAGERRLRAAALAGLDRVPVLIRHTDDADLLKEALVENIHRVQLNPLEEAAAYQQLLDDFGVTKEELATKLGRSRPAVSNSLRLLKLPPAVQRRVAAGVLSAGHAKALLAIEDPTAQSKLAERIVAEGLSVRGTEELIRLRMLDQDPTSAPRPRRTGVTVPGLVDLQEDLSDALEARVRISMGARKGRLAIEFTSVDDLERIVGVIADGLGHRGGSVPRPNDTDGTT